MQAGRMRRVAVCRVRSTVGQVISSDGRRHVVETLLGPVRLDDGVLDERVRLAFSRGQCHAFAVAVHELTGWPVEVVIAPRSRRDRVQWEFPAGPARQTFLASRWVHAVVRVPDGRLVDVCGVWSEEVLLGLWSEGAGRLVAVSPAELLELPAARRSLWSASVTLPADMESARVFAGPVLIDLGVLAACQ